MRPALALLGLLLAGGVGCAGPIHVQPLEEARAHPVRRVALMPLRVQADGAGGMTRVEAGATEIVSSRLVEALTLWTGMDLVPPEAIGHWIESDRDSPKPACAAGAIDCLDRELARAFGVDAFLRCTVRRYQARQGSAAAVRRPASVWFELDLRSAAGVPLWHGGYDETQHNLSEDLGSLRRAWARGFRWVSAESLASYGARELVQRLEAEVRRWR